MQDIHILKQNLPYYLQSKGVDVQKATQSNTVCPICGNGANTGCFHYYPDEYRVKCFSCGFNGDLFDLIAHEEGITNAEAIAKARRIYENSIITEQPKVKRQQQQSGTAPMDYSTFLFEAEKQNDFKYLLDRGISADTQRRFHIGLSLHWRSPQAIQTILQKGGSPEKLPTSPRCIIPRNRYNYLARDTRSDLTPAQKKYTKQNTGRTSLFNAEALKDSLVFVTEGEIDAMSIVEVGGNACALCSVANRQMLLNTLDRATAGKVLVLMLDNDKAGRRVQAELAENLKSLGIAYICAEYPDKIKDPNEWLMTDREGLKSAISLFKARAKQIVVEQKGNEYRVADVMDYFANFEQQFTGCKVKTGFSELDEHLNGGLHEGLYIIGAISSLGKTTFTLQLADQIAAMGQNVIFFSLEMSMYELIAKSLSRYTYQIAGNKKTNNGETEKPLARDTQQILDKSRYIAYNDDEKAIIRAAFDEYKNVAAQHLFIYEGRYQGERLKVSHIREIVKRHIQSTKQKPVVFVDYLQILAPADAHATDKHNTDTNTFELKEISRDYHIPVVAVSSFNRDNYQEPVSMQSFKESGAIEYSSDVLFGLQYTGMDYQDGEGSDSRKKRIRELTKDILRRKREREPISVDLKCLKQRTGYQFSINLAMMPAYNNFTPMAESAPKFADNKPLRAQIGQEPLPIQKM